MRSNRLPQPADHTFCCVVVVTAGRPRKRYRIKGPAGKRKRPKPAPWAPVLRTNMRGERYKVQRAWQSQSKETSPILLNRCEFTGLCAVLGSFVSAQAHRLLMQQPVWGEE